ncbi:MAG: GNAT family N-acetyltransferase [Candidatus Thermoplasmatota archaeon]|nr:GNAT family N-acetyltransferase [Candidatus Thermoplasmatota archaeon]
MIVRLASVDDLPGLMSVEERCFGTEKFSQETVLAFLIRDDAFVVVAEDSREFVGSAMCLASSEEREGRIASLAVPGPMRGRGVGAMLLRQCEKIFEGLGLTTYTLEVETTNEKAISMYHSHGYEVAGLIQDFYGLGRPAYFMVKKTGTGEGAAVTPS